MDEPIKPPERQAISPGWWYCLHCKEGRNSEWSIKTHVTAAHGVEREEHVLRGSDYASGGETLSMEAAWGVWANVEAQRFVDQLGSLRGADDFVTDCGDRSPDVERLGP